MRDRLAEAEGGPKLRQTFNLGLFLADWGRLEDALDVLRPFEQGDPMVALDRPNSLAAAGYAVELRLELGDVEGAERAQAQVREQLKEVDVPEEALLAELHEAALERLAGRTSDAIRRLESALAHSAGEVTAGIEPDVGWLLAVVRREGGDRDGAFQALRAAWAGAGQDYQNPAVWLILLERAAALIGTDPRRAARLVGLVRARCEVPLLHRGVSYDMDAMQAEIRSALGRSEADALLAEGGASELPDVLPEDQDERDVVEQPHG
jgi:tetratricopeptide (TPR) repeat protein